MTIIIKRHQFRLATRRLSVIYARQPLGEHWWGLITWDMTALVTYNTYASAKWRKEKGKLNVAFDQLKAFPNRRKHGTQ